MLLVHDLPVSDADRAARVWWHRERIELEAAGVFEVLGAELAAFGAFELARRAAVAAVDERRHAVRCRALAQTFGGADAAPLAPGRVVLGPPELGRRDRMLYAAVAVGCITESLSCALLLELRDAAEHPAVVATVDEILRDEIEHARIGWATLAAEAGVRDVSWLSSHVAGMRAAAVAEEVAPMTDPADSELGALGVLPRRRITPLVAEAWASVIVPGLERFGVRA